VCYFFFLDFGISKPFKHQFSFVVKFPAFQKTQPKEKNYGRIKHDNHYSNSMQNANIQVEGIG
jgi:hypothetical protein